MNESGNPCVFSPCRKWRYLLKHTWRDLLDPEERAIAWIALNPSTADENQLDPTLRRIRGYTRDMGYNTFYMLNLFAYRATDPKVMRAAEDPVGPENDYWIKKIAIESQMVVCAWGLHGKFMDRQDHVLANLRELPCDLRYMELSKDGIPKHPLYLKSELRPQRFNP